jgi:heme-degrading monooxygenase HmoA
MIAILWRYRVRPEARQAFELAYGPEGDWVRQFRQADGFLGTELLRGPEASYLTIDRWRSLADFDAFLASHRPAYDALDRETEGWTLQEERIGAWEVAG